MYILPFFARCPKCREDLEVEKVLDVEHCGDEVVLQVSGYCPECFHNYKWEEVFILDTARNIEDNS